MVWNIFMFGIRVDANSKIATGHVMRCLSIAASLRKAGIDCIFISADKNTENLIAYNNFKSVSLDSQWDNLDSEIESLSELIIECKIDNLLIDSYFVTDNYLSHLSDISNLIYIDDLNLFHYNVSTIINYNIYYCLFDYYSNYNNTETNLLLGTQYAPLRDEFKFISPCIRNKVKKVLITSGGNDCFNVTGKLLNEIIKHNKFQDIMFYVVIGKLNKYKDYLINLSNIRDTIILYENVKSMSDLMMQCDIAITAGGSTMYELCACGIPSICFSFADNQLLGTKSFNNEKLMFYAGDIRNNEEACLTNIIHYIDVYINNFDIRSEVSTRMRDKVDGYGTNRIVSAITGIQ